MVLKVILNEKMKMIEVLIEKLRDVFKPASDDDLFKRDEEWLLQILLPNEYVAGIISNDASSNLNDVAALLRTDDFKKKLSEEFAKKLDDIADKVEEIKKEFDE